MKKISDLLKPFLLVIFGALLFLCYFDLLGSEGAGLAIGIVALVLAVYFLTVGLLGTLLGDKFPAKTKALLNACGIGAYPVFMGVYFLLVLISRASNEWVQVGPMGWTLAIFSIGASFALAVFYYVGYFTKQHGFIRGTFLTSALFVLALLLEILLTNGSPATLGSIVMLEVVLYGVYTSMLLESLKGFKDALKAPKAEEAKPEEEPKAE